MKSILFDGIHIDKISNGYTIEYSYHKLNDKEEKEWDRDTYYCSSVEEVMSKVGSLLIN